MKNSDLTIVAFFQHSAPQSLRFQRNYCLLSLMFAARSFVPPPACVSAAASTSLKAEPA